MSSARNFLIDEVSKSGDVRKLMCAMSNLFQLCATHSPEGILELKSEIIAMTEGNAQRVYTLKQNLDQHGIAFVPLYTTTEDGEAMQSPNPVVTQCTPTEDGEAIQSPNPVVPHCKRGLDFETDTPTQSIKRRF